MLIDVLPLTAVLIAVLLLYWQDDFTIAFLKILLPLSVLCRLRYWLSGFYLDVIYVTYHFTQQPLAIRKTPYCGVCGDCADVIGW